MKGKLLKSLFITALTLVMILSCFGCQSGSAENKDNSSIVATINDETFPEALLRDKAEDADKNGDGKLSENEVNSVTKLNLKKLLDDKGDSEDGPLPEYTEKDFTIDLEGIQYFTNITELTVDMNGGEIFVKDASENIPATCKGFENIYELKNLQKLSLSEIDITELDISKLERLKRLQMNFLYNLEEFSPDGGCNISMLWISGCDKLTTLDLSKLDKLSQLDIVDNKSISKITFSESSKKVKSLQLTGLSSLEEIGLTHLSGLVSLNLCDVALTALDVSSNTKLEDLSAEGLSLETLDLTSNKKISYLINAKDSFKEILLPDDNVLSMIRWTDSEITEFPNLNLNPDTLTGIDIQGTRIKELDVSIYPNLDTLYYDEDITEILK